MQALQNSLLEVPLGSWQGSVGFSSGSLSGHPGPHGGGFSGVLGHHGGSPAAPAGITFVQPDTSILDQSIADMNRSVRQPLAVQQTANAQLQLQAQQS